MYLEEIKEDDKRIADVWKQYEKVLLCFQVPHPTDLHVRLHDKPQDSSLLRNCLHIYH